mgnify:CR=1 FL=1
MCLIDSGDDIGDIALTYVFCIGTVIVDDIKTEKAAEESPLAKNVLNIELK